MLKAGKRMHSSKASQEYWPSSCYRLGLVDGPSGGIFFKNDSEGVRLYEEAAAALRAGGGLTSGGSDATSAPPTRKKVGKKKRRPPKRVDDDKTGTLGQSAFGGVAVAAAANTVPDTSADAFSIAAAAVPNDCFWRANDTGDVELDFELDVNNDLDADLESWMQKELVNEKDRCPPSRTTSLSGRRYTSLNRAQTGPAAMTQTPDSDVLGMDGSFSQNGTLSTAGAQQQQTLQLVNNPAFFSPTLNNYLGGNAEIDSQLAIAGGPGQGQGHSQMAGSRATREMGQTTISNDILIQRVRLAYDAIQATREMRFIGSDAAEKEDERRVLFDLGKELYELFADRPPFEDGTTEEKTHPIDVYGSGPSKKRREQPLRQNATDTYAPLIDLGFPTSVDNLVSNLLGIDTILSAASHHGANQHYRSIQEVEEDLHRMMTDPDRFLYDADLVTESGQLDVGVGTRLYGQDSNIKELLLAFDRVVKNSQANAVTSSEVVVVAGCSGTGKSSLVRHVQGPMMLKGGLIIFGKFDEKRKGQPLSAIVDALEQFCDLLQMESVENVEAVRNAIKEALGEDVSVLTGLVPGLIKITGVPEGTSSFTVGSREAHQRLIFLFGRLLGAIARRSRPLIFVMDDLQCADEFSLELLRSFVCDTFLTPLLILGCYRENEVVEGHPLKVLLGKLVISGARVSTLRTGNMDETTVNALVSDALHMSPRLTESLSSIMYRKTDGNGLFVVQFLKSLCDEGLLTFSLLSRQWVWDVDAITSRDMADDVVGLMTMKMLKLDTNALCGLKIASCLGSQCDESTIKYLGSEYEGCGNGMSPLLDVAVDEGLMFKVGTTYNFAHDEIQNAAYCMIPEAERKSVHLQIGRELYSRVPPDQLDTVLFIAVDQFFRGADVITSRDEVIRLAHLALRAGDAAIAASAFLPASLYLLQSIGLLEESDWIHHYDLTLQLYSSAAEACFVLGKFDVLNELSREVIQNAVCLKDKIRVYFSLTSSLSSQGKMCDAIDFGLGVLEQLGETFPSNLDDDEVIADYVVQTSTMLAELGVEDVLKKEIIQDESKMFVMQLLGNMVIHSYTGRPRLCPVVSSRMVQLTLTHGVCRESAFAFAVFGSVVSRSHEDIMQGYGLGKIALSLMKRLDAKGYLSRVYAAVYGLINCFVEPLQACEESHKYAYEAGLSTGDVEFANANALLVGCAGAQSGSDLQSLANQLSLYNGKMKEMNTKTFLTPTQVYECFARNLVGETDDPTELIYGGNDLLSDMLETQNKNALSHYYFARMILAYIFGRYELATEMADQCRKAAPMMRNQRLVNEIFYLALIALASADEEAKSEARDAAAVALKELEGWLGTSQWNFLHKVKLLKAEIAFHDGNIDDTATLYDDAIRIAGEHRFVHEQALACERCGVFYSNSGSPHIAKGYFTRACEYYLKWGAKRKASDLFQQRISNEGRDS